MAGIYGLSGSGLDVDTIVKNLMQAQSTRYNTLFQKKTQMEWKKAEFNKIYTSINEFRNSTVWNSTLQSNLKTKSAVSSNESVAKVTASADALNVNHVLTVSQLASGATKTSSSNITTGQSKDTMAQQFGLAKTSFELKINGKSITVDTSQSINSLVSSINNADVGVKASYDSNMDRFFLYTTETGSAATIDFTGTSATGLSFLSTNLKLGSVGDIDTSGVTSNFNVWYGIDISDSVLGDGSDVTLDKMGYSGTFNMQIKDGNNTANITVDTTTDTIQTLMDKINAANVNAEAAYSYSTGSGGLFSLKATNGASLDLSGSDAAGIDFMYRKLKMPIVQAPEVVSGTDAKFTLNGAELTQTTNNFSVAGVNYELTGTGTISVRVSTDTAKIVENVKTFVEAYNTELAKLQAAVSETKYKDFLPLTDDERSALTESEIKLWEEKAKSGMLYRNPILMDAVTKMRNDIMTAMPLTGNYKTASSIGITTGDYLEGGKLYLDEAKLTKALEEDPDVVYKIFGVDGSETTHYQKGLAGRLYDTLKEVSDKIVAEAGATISSEATSNLAKQITAYQTNMDNWELRLQAMEERYYTKFNALEVALSNLSQQSSWLESQFAALSGS